MPSCHQDSGLELELFHLVNCEKKIWILPNLFSVLISITYAVKLAIHPIGGCSSVSCM